MATFQNRATLSFNGGSTDSNTVTGTFIETLSVSKTATREQYAEGTLITYAVSLVNSGTTSFTGLTVTDDLGAYDFNGTTVYPLVYEDGSLLYYINGVLQADPTVEAGPPLAFTGISVPAGGNTMIIYSVFVGDAAPPEVGGSVINTVTVTGAGLAEPITASETVFAINEPALNITKALSPTAVPENGTITYTFVISNSGNTEAVATDNLVVTDVFDPILNITSVTLNGAPLEEGTGYTYNDATGEFATVQSVITVPAATYTRQPDGSYVTVPGEATLVVVGTL